MRKFEIYNLFIALVNASTKDIIIGIEGLKGINPKMSADRFNFYFNNNSFEIENENFCDEISLGDVLAIEHAAYCGVDHFRFYMNEFVYCFDI